MTLHLTHEQLCDLILADSSFPPEGEPWNDLKAESDVVQEHLRACLICSAELRSLRDSSLTFAMRLSPMPGRSLRRVMRSGRRLRLHTAISRNLSTGRRQLSCLSLLCFRLACHRQRPAPPVIRTTATSLQTTESDEALLADIDQKSLCRCTAPMARFRPNSRDDLDDIHFGPKTN